VHLRCRWEPHDLVHIIVGPCLTVCGPPRKLADVHGREGLMSLSIIAAAVPQAAINTKGLVAYLSGAFFGPLFPGHR